MPDDIRVFWLDGPQCSRLQVINNIKSQLGKYDYSVYYDDTDFEIIRYSILTENLFDNEKRLIILYALPGLIGKEVDKRKKEYKKILSDYKDMFEYVPDGTVVVVNGISTKECVDLANHVKDIGQLCEFPKYLDENGARLWVFNFFSSSGIMIEDDDIKFFVDRLGVDYQKGIDFDFLSISVDKILAYLGRKKDVSRSDITKVIDIRGQSVIWDMYDVLDKKDLKKSLVFSYNILSDAAKISSSAEFLISSLMWRFRMLIIIKSLSSENRSYDDIQRVMATIGKIKKEDGSLSSFSYEMEKGSIKPQFSSKAIKAAMKGYYNSVPAIDRYTMDDLLQIIDCLTDCSIEARLSRSDIRSMGLIDNICMSVCKSMSYDKLKSMRRTING